MDRLRGYWRITVDPPAGGIISIKQGLHRTSFLDEAEWEALLTHLPLSPRERMVARLWVGSHTLKDIAVNLGSSPQPVRTHLKRIYRRLAVSNKFELLLVITNLLVRNARMAREA
jgi:DNA-binding CsgD family transcriptional regulator